ncbi:hypothetical protein [Salinicola acroporae]|uniref:Uncharacterized protein n=1 Tax=Salinicola acroporae TaxID=1541440 RepID=A0ABT6I4P5_9GAMM|nr:hypothetical protein [Salinicola acroporae]MDH4572443.1 hypothetical protein [Salinicola acroporae]
MTVHIPDYSQWTRDALLDETHKQASIQAKLSGEPGDANARRVKIATAGARYHAAMLALLELTEPFDKEAAARVEKAKAWNRKERDRYFSVALGTEFLQRHDADAMGQVRV